ncbi:MAG: cache domain-containing protein, partial [Planctomycetes bacterium]|nr:cache domain-containing protein [Planctomycetota bacterium]
MISCRYDQRSTQIAQHSVNLIRTSFHCNKKAITILASESEVTSAFEKQDSARLAKRFEVLINADEYISSFFCADKNGKIWSIYPPDKKSNIDRFYLSDWYAGVSKDWQVYVAVQPPLHTGESTCAYFTAPVRNKSGKPIGILGLVALKPCRIDLLERAVSKTGAIYTIEKNGRLLCHTRLKVVQEMDISKNTCVQELLKGKNGVGECEDILTKDRTFEAYA